MLSDQEISFIDSLVISLTGLSIVMLELAVLALMVIVLSKIVGSFTKKKTENEPPKAVPVPVAPQAASMVSQVFAVPPVPQMVSNDAGIAAAIMVSICDESGIPMEEIIFKSITRIQ